MSYLEKLEQLSISVLQDYAYNLPSLQDDLLYKTYDKLIAFTKTCLKNINETTIVGLAHMVYGWMPTMLKCKEVEDYDEIIKKINEGSLEKKFLENIKYIVNNSIVGGSKLLHFMNPEKYAIFDSRVYKAITGKKGYNYNTNNINNYILYINKLRELSSEAGELKKYLIKRDIVNVHTSVLRCMEICLFYRA